MDEFYLNDAIKLAFFGSKKVTLKNGKVGKIGDIGITYDEASEVTYFTMLDDKTVYHLEDVKSIDSNFRMN